MVLEEERGYLIYLGAVVIDARLCSVLVGANRFEPNSSQSNVFCRSPHERRILSETSLISEAVLDSIAELFRAL